MKQIRVGKKGHFALVDDADFELASTLTWSLHRSKRSYGEVLYATNGSRGLHRLIMGDPPGLDVDHRDGDGLNNQRSNLRVATGSQNCRNSRKAANCSSQFKGVSWTPTTERWLANIYADGRNLYLGSFRNEAEAALAYNVAARDCFGEFAHLNEVTPELAAACAANAVPIRPRAPQAKPRTISGLWGVTWAAEKERWIVEVKGERVGSFVHRGNAIRAYNEVAAARLGPNTPLNEPEEGPPEPVKPVATPRETGPVWVPSVVTPNARFMGVRANTRGQEWVASIRINGKTQELGRFELDADAARAFNEAALLHHGTRPQLNLVAEDDPGQRTPPFKGRGPGKGPKKERKSRAGRKSKILDGLHGVYRRHRGGERPWRATIEHDGEVRRLGAFASRAEATAAYDLVAGKLNRDGAGLNHIQ